MLKSLIYLGIGLIVIAPVDKNYQSLIASNELDLSVNKSVPANKEINSKLLFSQTNGNIKNIIVIGKGLSEEEAAKNASDNALLISSPRYIRSRTVNRYREAIVNDKFQDKDRINRSRYSNYGFNKGSIVSFKLINSSVDNKIHSVIARVKVRQGNKKHSNHPLLKPPASSNKENGLQKVFVIGKGSSEKSAIQNAIEQALSLVVGDAITDKLITKSIDKLKYIVSKAAEEAELASRETIDETVSSYTEGYIESFDKIRIYKDGFFFTVEAVVLVRKKAFSSYLDEIY